MSGSELKSAIRKAKKVVAWVSLTDCHSGFVRVQKRDLAAAIADGQGEYKAYFGEGVHGEKGVLYVG